MIKRFTTLFSAFYLISVVSLAQQASNITVSPIAGSATSLKLDWTIGGGTSRIVVIRSGGSTWVPVNSTTYAATTAYPTDATTGTGPDFDIAGSNSIAAVVFNGAGTTVNVTNLAPSTFYTVQVYDYTAGPVYNFSAGANNPRTIWFYTNPAVNTNYIVPGGVNSITVQAWGAGGAGGGSGSATNGRAGGGGGAYVTGTITTTPATSYQAVIGLGGATSAANGTATTFGGGTLFSAAFGAGGLSAGDGPGAGGTAASSVVVGTATAVTKTSGSNGGNRANPSGGVGGNAGNTTGTGGTANASANGNPGNVPGGGGAGGGLNSEGGAGANGMVIVFVFYGC